MTSTTFHKRQYLSYHHDGRRIYETLERNGPMTAQELGRRLGIESNVLRGCGHASQQRGPDPRGEDRQRGQQMEGGQ